MEGQGGERGPGARAGDAQPQLGPGVSATPATNRRLPGPRRGHRLTGEQHWPGGVRPSADKVADFDQSRHGLELVDNYITVNW